MMETDAATGEQFDGIEIRSRCSRWQDFGFIRRKQAQPLQSGGYGHVEKPAGKLMELASRFQYLKGQRIDFYDMRRRFTIETAYIAITVMETHEPIHDRNSVESRCNGGMRRVSTVAAGDDLDKSAEKRPRSPNATGHKRSV